MWGPKSPTSPNPCLSIFSLLFVWSFYLLSLVLFYFMFFCFLCLLPFFLLQTRKTQKKHGTHSETSSPQELTCLPPSTLKNRNTKHNSCPNTEHRKIKRVRGGGTPHTSRQKQDALKTPSLLFKFSFQSPSWHWIPSFLRMTASLMFLCAWTTLLLGQVKSSNNHYFNDVFSNFFLIVKSICSEKKAKCNTHWSRLISLCNMRMSILPLANCAAVARSSVFFAASLCLHRCLMEWRCDLMCVWNLICMPACGACLRSCHSPIANAYACAPLCLMLM